MALAMQARASAETFLVNSARGSGRSGIGRVMTQHSVTRQAKNRADVSEHFCARHLTEGGGQRLANPIAIQDNGI